MFEWICNMDLIWGLFVTGVGVIIGGMGLMVTMCFIAYWISELWCAIPHRITNSIGAVVGAVGRVIWVIIAAMAGLGVLLLITLVVYDGICG